MKTTLFTTQLMYQTRTKAQQSILVEFGERPCLERHTRLLKLLTMFCSLSQVEIIGVSFVGTHQHKQLEHFQVFKILLTKLI